MKKLLPIFAFILIFAHAAFAEAPELKNIMPNSWKKLARLSEADERAFVSQGEGKKSMDDYKKENYRKNSFDFRVYRETVCGIEFYRLLIWGGELETFFAQTYGDKVLGDHKSAEYAKFSNEMMISGATQIVFVRGKDNSWKEIWNMPLRKYSPKEPIDTPWTDVFFFYDLMIRKLNEREIGFFTTAASIGIIVGNGDAVYVPNTEAISSWAYTGEPFGAYYNKIKGQLAGGCRTYFTKRTVDEEISSVRSKDEITIEASTYLFDPKCPLRYSIQNAFDGDPATSYVENTEDDLMKMDFQHLKEYNVTGMAIINGYASSENLYLSNNRIASYKYNSKGTPVAQGSSYYINEIILVDKNLSYQIFTDCFPNHPYAIASGVKKIYKGEKYNDTCLAEVNLIQSDGNFLFGDIK